MFRKRWKLFWGDRDGNRLRGGSRHAVGSRRCCGRCATWVGGAPSSVIVNRRVNRRTLSPYRTRVITDGVILSLHVEYQRSRIKQLRKGRARATHRAVIKHTYDFGVGGRLICKLDAGVFVLLGELGRQGVRRLSSDTQN